LLQRNPSTESGYITDSEVVIDLYRKNAIGRWEIISYQAAEEVELTSINLVFSIKHSMASPSTVNYRGKVNLSRFLVENIKKNDSCI
jgi:hypothetical protein